MMSLPADINHGIATYYVIDHRSGGSAT